MELRKWIKPGTSEARIYINDLSDFFGKKPFIIKNDSGNWEIKCFGAYQSQIDSLYDMIESKFDGLGSSFDELLNRIGE